MKSVKESAIRTVMLTMRDLDKVLEEFAEKRRLTSVSLRFSWLLHSLHGSPGDVFVGMVVNSQLKRHIQHCHGEKSHPGGAIGLKQRSYNHTEQQRSTLPIRQTQSDVRWTRAETFISCSMDTVSWIDEGTEESSSGYIMKSELLD